MASEQHRRNSRGILLSSKNKENGKIGILLTSLKDLTFEELLGQQHGQGTFTQTRAEHGLAGVINKEEKMGALSLES